MRGGTFRPDAESVRAGERHDVRAFGLRPVRPLVAEVGAASENLARNVVF